eukprot:COSAG06_NODE_9455_length_1897_cov_1.145161_1_plen_96_part_10
MIILACKMASRKLNCGGFLLHTLRNERRTDFEYFFVKQHTGSYPPVRKLLSFVSLLLFCPEPVLVKRSFLCINGSKRPFLLTCMALRIHTACRTRT